MERERNMEKDSQGTAAENPVALLERLDPTVPANMILHPEALNYMSHKTTSGSS